MKPLTIKEAAEIAGVSRQSIYKQVNNGNLSRTADKKIQFAELLRVYPEIGNQKEVEKEMSTSVNHIDSELTNKLISMLEKQLIAKDEQILNLSKQVEKLQALNERLQVHALPDPNIKKRWWQK